MELYDIIANLIFATISSSTIILYATLGEIITERSGVMNLGIEGMMLVGALCGFSVAFVTNNLILAVLMAGIVSSVMALIHAFLCITLRANQVVSGLALTIFGTGISSFFGKNMVGQHLPIAFNPINIPFLSSIPFLGKILFSYNILVYLAWFSALILFLMLKYTRWGLYIKSTGEKPLSSDIMGVPVLKIRYLSTIFGGFMAGISGAYLTLAYTPLWGDGMTAGKGWIAVALVIFANWNPLLAIFGTILFGGLEALQLRLQPLGVAISPHILNMIPYLFTILILVVLSFRKKRSNSPSSLGNPYFREERQ
jgi:simple sugar transport system permease protein